VADVWGQMSGDEDRDSRCGLYLSVYDGVEVTSRTFRRKSEHQFLSADVHLRN